MGTFLSTRIFLITCVKNIGFKANYFLLIRFFIFVRLLLLTVDIDRV
jgi:hypothetical protein